MAKVMAGTDDLARSAVERLSEDESLRGDLSDVGFGPLLDWATAAVIAYGSKAGTQDAMDKYADRVRGVVQEAVSVAQNGKLDQTAALLDFEVADTKKATADLQALKLGEDADDNAVSLAAVLQAALQTPPDKSAPVAAPSASPPAAAPQSAATGQNASLSAQGAAKIKTLGKTAGGAGKVVFTASSQLFKSVNQRLFNRNRRPE